MLSIKEVEQLTGITKQNIRYYERQRLISPNRNPENDYREYSDKDIKQLKVIKVLRKLDMPIEEIRKILNHDITLSDAVEFQKERLTQERDRLSDALDFCNRINESELEQFDVDSYLIKMEEAEENGAVFANLLDDYKTVAKLEAMREFRFVPNSMCLTPSEFTDELFRYAIENKLNLVITKEGMYPEFTIDGIEYEAAREFSRYGAIIWCQMKNPDEIIPPDFSKEKYKKMSILHKFLPIMIIAVICIVLAVLRFKDIGSPAEVTVVVIGVLIEVFVAYRYSFNLKN